MKEYLTASGTHPEREKHPELTAEILANAGQLLSQVNAFLDEIGIKDAKVSSGFRPSDVNAATPGAAKKSNHCIGLAVDLLDPHGDIDAILSMNVKLLEKYGLYVEDSKSTPTWAHIQCIAPKSGKRFFIP